jgi:hypothetical protein
VRKLELQVALKDLVARSARLERGLEQTLRLLQGARTDAQAAVRRLAITEPPEADLLNMLATVQKYSAWLDRMYSAWLDHLGARLGARPGARH